MDLPQHLFEGVEEGSILRPTHSQSRPWQQGRRHATHRDDSHRYLTLTLTLTLT